MFLVDVLEECGCDVIGTAPSAAEALVAARAGVDVVFIDIGLRGTMDGIDTAVKLRAEHGAAIVFTSGASGLDIEQRSQAAEPLAFLQKPFLAADVEAVLARAAKLPR